MKFNSVPFSDLLSKVVDNRGKTCPTAEDGIPLIATNCIRNDLLFPAYDKVRYVSQDTYDSWFRGHPRPGDMIFVTKGSPGRVCWVPDPIDFCIAQDMVAIRADESKVNSKYLFALLRSDSTQFKIENMHVGTLIPHFKKGDFDKLILHIPDDFAYQKEGGEIYFDFCKKIDLNRQINQTLEQIAQAIFKSWFVDFEPVKAKIEAKVAGRDPERAAMCAISGKFEPELDQLPPEQLQQLAATAALFPDELVESELGWIPAGWEISEIGKEVTVVGGGTPSTANPDFWNGEFAWVTPKDLSRLSEKVLTCSERTISASGVSKISSGQLPVGTVLLSSRAPIGYLALTTIPVSINQGFIAMLCNKRLPNAYVLQWATDSLDAIKQRGSGTTFAEISKSNFRAMSVLVPGVEALDAFQQLVLPLYEQITACVREAEILATLRDTLLPKLLSGELLLCEADVPISAAS